jgi:hypothetical protein
MLYRREEWRRHGTYRLIHGGHTMRNLARRFSIMVLAAALLSTSSVIAAPTEGANEIQVSAGLFHAEGSDSGNLNADLSYGIYLSPGWQVGIRQALNYNFIDDERDFWVASTTPFINYHFRVTDIIFPYLGAFIGLVWNDRDVTGAIGPQVGVKFFVHERTFLNLGYRYEFFFNKLEAIDDNSDRGNHVFNLGIGLTWGGASRRP